jgi:hypothetical protein
MMNEQNIKKLFLYNAYIKVDDEKIRKELITFLSDLDDRVVLFSARYNYCNIIIVDNYTVRCIDNIDDKYLNLTEFVDCYDNIELFKALVAVNNTDDYMQWFVSDCNQAWVNQGIYAPIGSFELCLVKDRYLGQNSNFCSSIPPAHKASKEELIKHFKKI